MSVPSKKPEADLRHSHRIYLQLGLIFTLGGLIGLFRAPISPSDEIISLPTEIEQVQVHDIIRTIHIETPPPPPRPTVPMEVPDDQPVEDMQFRFDFVPDLAGPLNPPLPPADEDKDESYTYTSVEHMPEPVGGMEAIYSRVKYPEIARKAGIEGRVVIQFIVDERGNVVNPTVIRGIGGGCDEAAIDAIRGMRFKPGLQQGRPVKVQFQLPIVFRLQN